MEYARSAFIKKYISLALALLSLLIFGACSSAAPAAGMDLAASDALPTAAQGKEYTVKFYSLGTLLHSVSVQEWNKVLCPQPEETDGLRFLYWADESGAAVEPELEPVRSDAVYTAVYAPVLDRHEPYLFVNEAGLLRPDAALDNMELLAALNALASEEAKAYFPELVNGGGAVSGAMLRQTLAWFYEPELLDKVFVSFGDSDIVSRGQFAEIMNTLLGRGISEPVTISEGQLTIPDVRPGSKGYAQLMAASVAHGHGEGALPWDEISMKALYAPGFVLVEGWLYCVDESGYFVSDTLIGSLTFGYDGRYTSGDSALDAFVAGILNDLAFAHPGADRLELLEAAYDYVRDSIQYLRKNTYDLGAVGWQIPDAISTFESGQGSCYGYAAAFWALARGLGYEAEAFSGAIGKEMQPHAWVEIDFEGTSYIFDPETEAESIREGQVVRDMFMLHPDIALNWQYYKG